MRAIAGVSFFLSCVLLISFSLDAFGIKIPPAITGMMLVFIILFALKKPPVFLEEGAATLFRFFPLLFIPPLTKIVGVLDIVWAHLLVILFATTVSSFMGLWATAKVYSYLAGKRSS